MAHVIQEYTSFIDTMHVTAATISTAWEPGNMAQLSGGQDFVALASGSDVYGMFLDDSDELSAPPTGSIVSIWHGNRCTIKADDATNAQAAFDYAATWTVNCAVYCDENGLLTADNTGSERRIGTCYKVPSVHNGFELGVVLYAI